MDITAIAMLSDGYRIVGYRLYSCVGNSYKDYSPADIYRYMLCGEVHVSNLGASMGEVNFTNGAEGRYPVIYTNGRNIKNGMALTVVSTNDGEYTLADAFGNTLKVTAREAYIKRIKLCNAKIVRMNDKVYIAAISGSLEVFEKRQVADIAGVCIVMKNGGKPGVIISIIGDTSVALEKLNRAKINEVAKHISKNSDRTFVISWAAYKCMETKGMIRNPKKSTGEFRVISLKGDQENWSENKGKLIIGDKDESLTYKFERGLDEYEWHVVDTLIKTWANK